MPGWRAGCTVTVMRRAILLLSLLSCAGCECGRSHERDAGADAGLDAGPSDAGPPDAGAPPEVDCDDPAVWARPVDAELGDVLRVGSLDGCTGSGVPVAVIQAEWGVGSGAASPIVRSCFRVLEVDPASGIAVGDALSDDGFGNGVIHTRFVDTIRVEARGLRADGSWISGVGEGAPFDLPAPSAPAVRDLVDFSPRAYATATGVHGYAGGSYAAAWPVVALSTGPQGVAWVERTDAGMQLVVAGVRPDDVRGRLLLDAVPDDATLRLLGVVDRLWVIADDLLIHVPSVGGTPASTRLPAAPDEARVSLGELALRFGGRVVRYRGVEPTLDLDAGVSVLTETPRGALAGLRDGAIVDLEGDEAPVPLRADALAAIAPLLRLASDGSAWGEGGFARLRDDGIAGPRVQPSAPVGVAWGVDRVELVASARSDGSVDLTRHSRETGCD